MICPMKSKVAIKRGCVYTGTAEYFGKCWILYIRIKNKEERRRKNE